MAKKSPREKQSYGGRTVDHFSPEATEQWPRAINVILSFEEAMKLQLSLQHRLLDINRLNRSTKAGKGAAVNLCVFTDVGTITVTRYP
jgi:hypothetical protein